MGRAEWAANAECPTDQAARQKEKVQLPGQTFLLRRTLHWTGATYELAQKRRLAWHSGCAGQRFSL